MTKFQVCQDKICGKNVRSSESVRDGFNIASLREVGIKSQLRWVRHVL